VGEMKSRISSFIFKKGHPLSINHPPGQDCVTLLALCLVPFILQGYILTFLYTILELKVLEMSLLPSTIITIIYVAHMRKLEHAEKIFTQPHNWWVSRKIYLLFTF
jgi:hypothetical protein